MGKEREVGGIRLRLQNICKSFISQGVEHDVLKGIDLQVNSGEFVAIVGRSGCGKSTLLRVIAGLESTNNGRILMDQKDPYESGKQSFPEGIRVMFQDSRLLPWRRVRQNVALGLRGEKQEKVDEVLEKVGLTVRAGDWPTVLSGGQRQRVALARALVHEPRLLLLDEPLGALDALTRIEMQQLIEKIWKEHRFTALLVTHDVAEAIALADRVILIDNGIIKLDVPVTLPRPRKRGSVALAEIEERILGELLGVTHEESSTEKEEQKEEPRHAVLS